MNRDREDGEFDYIRRETKEIPISDDITNLIAQAQAQLQSIDNNQQQDIISSQIAKLGSLKSLKIPMEDGSESIYYSMADNAGGVTEKTCLIDAETLKSKLEKLANAMNLQYIQQNKISMNAILKHPKAGKDTEVQREAIGLEIARILEFPQVTNSTLVFHNTGTEQHPCLFVPFGKMELLTDSIDNYQSLNGRIKTDKQNSIEDFGKYSAYFMLCSDPDFIGKNGQNKGLADVDGSKKLYIFDQVFMSDTNFGFDHGLNLIPTAKLAKLPKNIARHFMGRNKSVINDSSYEEKVGGICKLLSAKTKIQAMFKETTKANSSYLSTQHGDLDRNLRNDAKICLQIFNKRLADFKKFLPNIKVNQDDKSIDNMNNQQIDLLKKSMLLNSLLNKPKLFDKAGKPYRMPFFSKTHTSVKSINFDETTNQVTINFGRRFGIPISQAKKTILESKGFTVSKDGKSANIAYAKLLELNEKEFFKIQIAKIDESNQYINQNEIKSIAKIYKPNDNVINAVSNMSYEIADINNTLEQLNQLSLKNKSCLGFIQHIKKCAIFEGARQIIQTYPQESDKDNIKNKFFDNINKGNEEDFIKTLAAEHISKLKSLETNFKKELNEEESAARNSLSEDSLSEEKPFSPSI